jgi:tetratricopeptide (TPR) repeat protein
VLLAFAWVMPMMLGPPSHARAPDTHAAPATDDSARAAAAALRAGQYEEARRLAESNDRRHRPDATATWIAARAEIALGLYAQARERLEKALERAPRNFRLRHVLCDVLTLQGDDAALRLLTNQTRDDWNMGRVDTRNVDVLLAVAAIDRLNDNWQGANDKLRTAVRAAPGDTRPNVLWGNLFLEKHAVAEAETSFRAALATDPHDPDAHVGLATVLLRKHYDVPAADRELAVALKINHRHAGGLALRAEIAIDGEDFDTAAALLAEIRRTNPHDPTAAWLSAARARLLDDLVGYRRERDAHAILHPADGAFYAETADILIRHRRTDDARAVVEECGAVDPQNSHCQSVLGTTLLRLGDETAGVEALRRAWKRDPYDARTYNLLELYENVIPRMQTVSTKHLLFRIDPEARGAIERVVAPYLEETYVRYAAKYGFDPKGPIVFELYANPQQFAIRTVGLPGIAVEAVCFGRVIASQSPTNGAMNWGMVLTHELAHVFAIELSRSRGPLWFTEGLAELETMRARPEWTRHADRSLWGAATRGEMASLAALSNAFVLARDAEETTRAYAEAAAALDYLDRTFGFARIRGALLRFGTGARGLDVVAEAMNVPASTLERGFRADLAARYAGFEGQYLPAETLRLPRDVDGQAVDARPGTGTLSPEELADGQARAGLAELRLGHTEAARRAHARAVAIPGGADLRSVLFLRGEIALALRDADEARGAFLRMLALAGRTGDGDGTSHGDNPGTADASGADGYDVRVRLALAEIHRGDPLAAENHLRRAIAFDPGSAEATGLLVEVLGDPSWRGSRYEDRLRAIASTLRLEPLHAELATELVLGLARRGHVAEVIEAAPLAIFIRPGMPALHAALGRALAQTGKSAAAVGALERALALGAAPDEAAEIRHEIRQILAEIQLTRGNPPGQSPAHQPLRP